MAVYKEEELEQLHEIELAILSEVIRICDIHQLDYWIDWGTLLGAVRHQGFIPWDDDIDICMPRPDYEKFLVLASQELQDGYVLQHYKVDEKTPTYCAKVRKDGTLFVEENVVHIPVHQGVFIDIYPMDPVPSDEKKRNRFIKNASFWKQLYVSKSVTKPSLPHSKFKKVIYTFIRVILHGVLEIVPKKALYSKLDKSLRRYENERCEMISCIGTERGSHLCSEIYPLQMMKFEDLSVKAPCNTDAVLKKEYGDYMSLPPVEKRVGHSPKYFSLNIE